MAALELPHGSMRRGGTEAPQPRLGPLPWIPAEYWNVESYRARATPYGTEMKQLRQETWNTFSACVLQATLGPALLACLRNDSNPDGSDDGECHRCITGRTIVSNLTSRASWNVNQIPHPTVHQAFPVVSMCISDKHQSAHTLTRGAAGTTRAAA